jgi:hypothetical protein
MAGLISNREIAQVIGLDEGTVRSDIAENSARAVTLKTHEMGLETGPHLWMYAPPYLTGDGTQFLKSRAARAAGPAPGGALVTGRARCLSARLRRPPVARR